MSTIDQGYTGDVVEEASETLAGLHLATFSVLMLHRLIYLPLGQLY